MWHIKFMSTSCEDALSRMPQNTFDDKSTLVQAMDSGFQVPCTFFQVLFYLGDLVNANPGIGAIR